MPSSMRPRQADPLPGNEIGVLETLFEAVPFPIAVVDASGDLNFANAAFRLEWPDDAAPASLIEMIAPQDRSKFIDALGELAPASPRARLDLCFDRPAPRSAIASLAPLGRTIGGRLLVAVHLCDITEQTRLIKDLADRESLWNNALVNSVAGVWDHNWATGRKYYSPTWRKIRGMSTDDPLSATTEEWLQLVHPDDRDYVMYAMSRQNAGDPNFDVFEYRERHKKGHWIWILCRGACIEWDAEGKATRVVGTDIDITARKAAEEAMARMSRRLDMALEISGIGVYESDFDTGDVDWDERMFRIYGLAKREAVMIGGLWESLLHPDDASRVKANVLRHLCPGSRFSDEYRVILRDGTERVIRTHTMTFIDGNGHRKMVGANWDVTTDVALHRELERAKTLAEARNRELEEARISIEHHAMHDYLTDLPNRRYLDAMLDRLAAECNRDGHGIAILHIDLDGFKQINDTLGHAAGDMMLLHTARVLRTTVREDDFVARVGGDEFIVLSKYRGSPSKLTSLANRIVTALGKPVSYEGKDCSFGASIGIACDAGITLDMRQLLRNADIALYQAKNAGRNRHQFFVEDPKPA